MPLDFVRRPSRTRLALHFLRNLVWPGVTVSKVPSDIQVDWDVPVAVRDGTVLRVNVFRPEGAGPFPVIMSCHPYGKDKIPAKTRSGRGVHLQARLLPQPHPIAISEWTGWEAPDPVVWAGRGYAVVNADQRGGGTSEGTATLFSDQEAEDYHDLIEWAGTRDWSNGRVGLDGVSYLAISQYKVAALRPPHLAAICPWEGLTDLYRDFARPGGIQETGFSALWSRLTSRHARVSQPIADEIARRPEDDEWYRSTSPDLERIAVPALVCASFSDHLLHSRGSFEAFRRIGSASKRLYTHRGGKWSAYYGDAATLARMRFFDHTLKGVDNGWAEEAPVRLAITERGPDPVDVTAECAWPPPDLTWRMLWLDATEATLSEGEPPDGPGCSSFDVTTGSAAFTWTLPADMDVIGTMALRLHVEVTGADDVLLFVAVRKIHDGVEDAFEGSYGFSGDMVSQGWQRAAHRALDAGRSTPSRPVHRHDRAEPLGAGEIRAVDVELRPHATRFRAGDLLRVEVRGRWHFPRTKFGGQFPAGYASSRSGTCLLHTGGVHACHLFLGTRDVQARTDHDGGGGPSTTPARGR